MVVMRPIEFPEELVNHKAPSGPVVTAVGELIAGFLKVVIEPAVVIRPIEFPALLVNHRAPSGPLVIPVG